MSLDLTKVAAQVGGMIARFKDASRERQKHLEYALDTLYNRAGDTDGLKRKIADSRTTWLVADPVDRIDRHYATPAAPAEFTVLAADGSHIDVDRHRSTRCYLINIGSAVLHYGASPSAALDSFPNLYSGSDDLVIASGRGREQPVEGALLGLKRSVEECRHLANLAAGLPAGSSSLALLDGSLILWSLEAYPEFVTEALLRKGFLSHLEDMRKLNKDRRLALASYISFPRSTDVVNVLRIAICPHEPADCDRDCSDRRECDMVAGVQDRELLSSLLAVGERSAVFISPSQIQKHYGVHQVHFFYLRAGDEIARVEVPAWVAEDERLLNLAHSLVLDQCRRGQGYPVALSEAHEQAVVTNADKENFWELVEASSVDEHLPSLSSAKSFSKRTRWV